MAGIGKLPARIATALTVSLTCLLATPPAPASARAEDLSYTYEIETEMPASRVNSYSSYVIMSEVRANFTRYFPFRSNCLSLPWPQTGNVCNLYHPDPYPNPVLLLYINGSNFAFKSLPGHFEGADRFIRFTLFKGQFYPNRLYLRVEAWGPYTPQAHATITSGLAYQYWSQFALNIGSRAFA
ncbi:hypothetical protein ACIBKY_13710 [Nonomuraea sp. NPDC050394]|uniref:hypothetical protein n=1 Tax=Nonomuraea sp. NPDC050394 TaxID=3364363 RepID=UPI0037AC28FC